MVLTKYQTPLRPKHCQHPVNRHSPQSERKPVLIIHQDEQELAQWCIQWPEWEKGCEEVAENEISDEVVF